MIRVRIKAVLLTLQNDPVCERSLMFFRSLNVFASKLALRLQISFALTK